MLLIMLPIAALVSRSTTSDVWATLQQADTNLAIWLSLRTTLISISIVVLLGLPLAYFAARSGSRLASFFDALTELPIVLPPAVAGIALLALFGRAGWLGDSLEAAGIQITFTSAAVVIAQVFVSIPFFLRSAIEGIRKVDQQGVSAAALDGAGPVQVAWLVVLPQCRQAIFAGTLMAWARALGEFGATLMFAGNFVGRTQTMPLAIYSGFQGDLNMAVTLSMVLLAMAVFILVLARLFHRRSPS